MPFVRCRKTRLRATACLALLGTTLPAAAVEPLDTATSPTVAMAAWLTEQAAPACFDIGKECELKAADERGEQIWITIE